VNRRACWVTQAPVGLAVHCQVDAAAAELDEKMTYDRCSEIGSTVNKSTGARSVPAPAERLARKAALGPQMPTNCGSPGAAPVASLAPTTARRTPTPKTV
jgi:hypothetical protein